MYELDEWWESNWILGGVVVWMIIYRQELFGKNGRRRNVYQGFKATERSRVLNSGASGGVDEVARTFSNHTPKADSEHSLWAWGPEIWCHHRELGITVQLSSIEMILSHGLYSDVHRGTDLVSSIAEVETSGVHRKRAIQRKWTLEIHMVIIRRVAALNGRR